MQRIKLSQVRLRYKVALMILAAMYMCIIVIPNKLEITSSFWDLESRDMDRLYYLLTNQSETSGNTSRLDVISLFSATASSLNVQVILIEPSILFNLLTSQEQSLLLKRGSNLTNFKYVPGIVTFGFLNKYRKYITQPKFEMKMHLKGFNFIKTDSCHYASTSKFDLSGHYFFMTNGWKIHLVEFVRKLNYLRHSALPVRNCSSLLNREDHHFARYEGIYENFNGMIINRESKIVIPSEPLRFLHEIKTSKFIKCRGLLQPKEKHPKESEVPRLIREMKTVLHPQLYDFWLTSGTLLGWYRECGMIPYTHDVDFGMRASDVKNMDSILKIFRNSESLRLVRRLGLVEEALELTLSYKGLNLDIFYFYEERNQSYVACHYAFSQSYAKVLYPLFSLCSAALLGEKVLVPCETELILRTEYGTEWTQPVSKWDWTNSFYNKGPEIHWDNTKKTKVYQYF